MRRTNAKQTKNSFSNFTFVRSSGGHFKISLCEECEENKRGVGRKKEKMEKKRNDRRSGKEDKGRKYEKHTILKFRWGEKEVKVEKRLFPSRVE